MGFFGLKNIEKRRILSSATKKKENFISHQKLIKENHGVIEHISSSTEDDDMSASTDEMNVAPHKNKLMVTSAKYLSSKSSFRRLEEFEYEGGAGQVDHIDWNQALFDPIDAPRSLKTMSEPRSGKAIPTQTPLTNNLYVSESTKRNNIEMMPTQTSTPRIRISKFSITTNSSKVQSQRRIEQSRSKKKVLAYHLSSEYQPSKTIVASPSSRRSSKKQIVMVGSTDSSSYGEYEPPPFLPEHQKAVTPKATFYLEGDQNKNGIDQTTTSDNNPFDESFVHDKQAKTDAFAVLDWNADPVLKDSSRLEPFPDAVSVDSKVTDNRILEKSFLNSRGIQQTSFFTNNKTIKQEKSCQQHCILGSAEDMDMENNNSFDVRSWNVSPVITNNPVCLENSTSTDSADSDDHDANRENSFRQIVFNKSLDKIEQVAVARSDSGASDFSDLVFAASKLSQTITGKVQQRIKEKKTSRLTTPKSSFPVLQKGKGKDTPSIVSHNSFRSKSTIGVSRKTFVAAPSSLPSYRMKEFQGFDKKHMSQQDDGFSLFPSGDTSLSSRRRYYLRAADHDKPITPLGLRTEPSKKSSSVPNSSFTDAFSEKSCSKNSSVKSVVSNVESDEQDFFFGSESDPFRNGKIEAQFETIWDPKSNPFPQSSTPYTKGLVDMNVSNLKEESVQSSQVSQTVSMDDGLIATIRNASRKSKGTDPETDSRKRDPSPTKVVRQTVSDGNMVPSFTSRPTRLQATTSSTLVPTHAILGSMLFRQTLATQFMESKNERKVKLQQHGIQIQTPKDGNDLEDEECSGSTATRSILVPESVPANGSVVCSSVTEEASSFCDRSFPQCNPLNSTTSGANKWNRQVQNVLNNFSNGGGMTQLSALPTSRENGITNQPTKHEAYVNTNLNLKPILSRLEEEHASIFEA